MKTILTHKERKIIKADQERKTRKEVMAIVQAKKEFIKKVSGGLHVLMATTYTADEIAIDPNGEIEEYIAEHLLECEKSAIGVERAWFSERKFDHFMDTESDDLITKILDHMDDLDMTLWRVLDEASMYPDDFTEQEKKFTEMIRNEEMSFIQFI